MKIYDLTQEIFSSIVFPGDPAPKYTRVRSMENGEMCNLTEFSMCAHNGTHMDAPFHFIRDGITIEQIDLNRCVGDATVVSFEGEIGAEEAKKLVENAKPRLLIKGDVKISAEAGEVFAENLLLLGIEPQSVGMAHIALLSREIAILEGLVLKEVPEGDYFLSAAPIKLGGCDGAPCRPLLFSCAE